MVGNLSNFGGKRSRPFGKKRTPAETGLVAKRVKAKRVLKASKTDIKHESLNFAKVVFDAIESEIDLSYVGFQKLSSSLKAKGASNPDALAAWIGRRKYGKKFTKAAAKGVSLRPKK